MARHLAQLAEASARGAAFVRRQGGTRTLLRSREGGAGGRSPLQLVWCVKASGLNGSYQSPPTWLYDVFPYPDAGTEPLATGLAPQWRPSDAGRYTDVSISTGIAYVDGGTVVLLMVFGERLDTEACWIV